MYWHFNEECFEVILVLLDWKQPTILNDLDLGEAVIDITSDFLEQYIWS